MLKLATSLLALAATTAVVAQDPASSWLSYAVYAADPTSKITVLNTTWTVPTDPVEKFGSNAPGFWFGVQIASGRGALIQPILAWADGAPQWTIFNGVYDWNDNSWYQSRSSVVKAGDTIYGSVLYRAADDSYDLVVGCKETGWSVRSNHKVRQGQVESTAYFVVEHQPATCRAYPASGEVTFTNIYLEVEGKPVTPQWQAKQQRPACQSEAHIIDPTQIKFTWSAAQAGQQLNGTEATTFTTFRH